MKILVTGANGLLGQKVVALLATAPENQVIATGRGEQRIPEGPFEWHSCELTDEVAVAKLIRHAQPELIIHCAAMTQVDACEQSPEACHEHNVSATGHLLRHCPKHTFFLYVSTDFVFDGEKGMYCEGDMPNPISVYGRSKWDAEQLVAQSALQHAIVRTVLVYGVTPGMSRSNLVLWVRSSLEAGKPIRVVNDQWRTPTLAEDLAWACAKIGQERRTGVWHISGPQLLTPYQIAQETARFFSLDENLITPVDASTFSQPGKRPPKTGFNIRKAQEELGFSPRNFEEGLAVLRGQLRADRSF